MINVGQLEYFYRIMECVYSNGTRRGIEENTRGGGGVDLSIKMPGCVCWGSENVPILRDSLGKKKNTHIRGFSANFIPILWCNIKLKCINPKGHSQYIIFESFWYSLC